MDFYWFSVFVAVHALLLLVLAFYVSLLRMRHKVARGDGGQADLSGAIRAHANGVEHALPFALLILALSLQLAGDALLGGLVLTFTLARVLHALGMIGGLRRLRFWGAVFSYLLSAVAVAALVWATLF